MPPTPPPDKPRPPSRAKKYAHLPEHERPPAAEHPNKKGKTRSSGTWAKGSGIPAQGQIHGRGGVASTHRYTATAPQDDPTWLRPTKENLEAIRARDQERLETLKDRLYHMAQDRLPTPPDVDAQPIPPAVQVQAAVAFMNRVDGMPAQKVDQTIAGKMTLQELVTQSMTALPPPPPPPSMTGDTGDTGADDV